MTNTTQNGIKHTSNTQITIGLPDSVWRLACAIKDAGRVRLGGQGPAFQKSTVADAGKVRLGGQGPVFRKISIADAGKVRLGGQGPIFR